MFRASRHLLLWTAASGLFVVAALVYLLDPHVQHFETRFPFADAREALQPVAVHVAVPGPLRYWLPDFAWAALAALLAGEMLRHRRLSRLSKAVWVIAAATSWEILQAVALAPGRFDAGDLAVSGLAAALVLLLSGSFESPREKS